MATPQALEGYRVLDLADEKAVYCGKLLADLGADVIKVEPPGGDRTRGMGPFWRGAPHPDRSLFFWYMNTSKRGITLDVTKRDGQELFRRLARSADVVVESAPPGWMDGLGIGFEALRAVNPRLVFASVTGFGQSGPYRDFRADEMIAMAMGGVMHSSGPPERPPVRSRIPAIGYLASMHAAQGVLMALRARRRTARGQHVDISMQESAATTLCEFGVNSYTGPMKFSITRWYGHDRTGTVPFGNYPCKDGYVSLIITRPAHWTTFIQWCAEVTGNTEILDEKYEGDRRPHVAALRPIFIDFAKRFTKAALYAEGQRRHLTFVPVNTIAEVAAHAQLAARGYFAEVRHKELGATVRYPGAPYQLSASPWRIGRRPPLVGEHNAEVYGKELGLAPPEIAAMRTAGVV